MTTNAQRAAWAEKAVSAFARETNQSSYLGNLEDYLDMVADLFVDLLHLCDREGLDIDQILRRAHHHHDEEVFEESGDPESLDYNIAQPGGQSYVPAAGASPAAAPFARRRGRHLTMG